MKTKTEIRKLIAVALFVFSVCGFSHAAITTTCVWTGAEDNYWTNKNNWVNGVMPSGSSCKAVFDPGEGQTIYVNMKSRGWGSTSTWPNTYEFKSGNTYFSTYIRYTGSSTVAGVFDVAEGAKAVVSNEIFTATGKCSMRKTGKGTLACVGKIGANAEIPVVTVEEGTLRYYSQDSGHLGNLSRVEVKSGAVFYTSGGSQTLGSGKLVVDIEKGGLFKASCGGYSYANTIDHLEGEGTVEGVNDYALTIKGTTAGKAFSGNFTGNVRLEFANSQNPVIIGGVDTLSSLNQCVLSPSVRFLPSDSPYVISYSKMVKSGSYAALDINGKPVGLKSKNRITIAGGDMEFSFSKWYTTRFYGFYWGSDDSGFTINSGRYCATPVSSEHGDATRDLPFPDGMVMRIGHKNSSIAMYGGELWLYARSDECQMPSAFDLYGGDLSFVGAHRKNVFNGATADNPAVLNLRGGRVVVSMRDDLLYGTSLFPETNAFRVVVHDKPAVVKAVHHSANGGEDRYIQLNRPIESGVEEGKDGGLAFEGATVFRFKYPVLLNGGFTAMDGEIQILDSADVESVPAFLGTGDVNLGNVKFRFANEPTKSKTLKFAVDEGAAFRVKGAAQLTFKTSDGAPAHHIEVLGGYERVRGGVLFLYERGCANGFDSSFKVAGGLPLNSAGLTKSPVLFYDPGEWHRFATCNADGCIVPLEDTASGLDDASDKAVFLNADAALAAGEEKSVAALMLNDVKLTLAKGSKLNVGIGDDPALFVYNRTHWSNSTPTGTGTVDFGSREGVFVIDVRSKDCGSLNIPYVLAGSGGITFVSTPEKNHKNLKLSGANTYSGTTTINSVRVEPGTAAAFGSSVVRIGGGERVGGQVRFGSAVKLENDFFVSGWGMPEDVYDTTSGAIVFSADAEIAGSVTLEGDTRIVARASSRATISGPMSGAGRFMLYQGNGTLVLSGANTSSGGTEIVKSTLAVTHAGALGSGDVVLNYGTLAIENAAPMTFTNALSGIGTVALKGTAPVKFDCSVSNLDASLDLCGTVQLFDELPPFASIVNSSDSKATIRLAPDLGTIRWGGRTLSGKISLDIGEGTTLDLEGGALDIYRLERSAIGKVLNGTVTEKRPIIGFIVTVR